MSESLNILGNITAEQFLTEYWQKKPLLIRNALPEIIGMFEPEDIKGLALEEHVTARLITQHGEHHDDWQVKEAPLSTKDFKKLPPFWTLLVQAVDHYSFDLAELWKQFSFIPQWRRDDVMVSYAPKGGSVGQHFDFYDVFLVQGYGHRRWQLGQMCDESTEFRPDQPLKLLDELGNIHFDEVLAPGDMLYVPPRLAHYGVAEDDCLTLSFGFRMPDQAQLMDRVSDVFADQMLTKTPILDIQRTAAQAVGAVSTIEFDYLKAQLLATLSNEDYIASAVMVLASEAKYPDNIPELDPLDVSELKGILDQDFSLVTEPANRIIYRELNDQSLEFWANGERLSVSSDAQEIFKDLANGGTVLLNSQLSNEVLEDLTDALNAAALMLIDPQESEED